MFELVELTYGTVRDYVRYCEEHPGLVGEEVPGDLKDVQRPWALETVNEYLPKGGRTLDLGGARCQLAAALAKSQDVTVIDPYDGRGNGPTDVEPYRKEYPELTFIEGLLEPEISIPRQDAVVSTSVVEHIPTRDHRDLVEAIHEVLAPRGYSIHAIDLTCRGVNGFFESQKAHSQSWLDAHGIDVSVAALASTMLNDLETFWLPVTVYQSWRREKPYNEYPWRQVGTLNMVARKKD